MSLPRPSAVGTLQIENERIRVTEWRFSPGAATGWHRHDYDYIVVPMTTGRLMLLEPGNAIRYSDLVVGGAYTRSAGVEHDVVNVNDCEFTFIEIELKDPS